MSREIHGHRQPAGVEGGTIKSTQLERRGALMSKYIDGLIAKKEKATADEEKEIKLAIEGLSKEEKALRIYEDILACSLERAGEPNPYVISEIRMLWHDEQAKQIFLEKYAEARTEARGFRLAGLGKDWIQVEKDINNLTERLAVYEQALRLKKVSKPTDVRATESRLSSAKKTLDSLQKTRDKIISLEGRERTPENTDAAAQIMYETIRKYHKEAKAGFAWMPSRRELHQKIIDQMEETGKSPLLIGLPGTGKTMQVEAVAAELTGSSSVRIPCTSTLSEEGLVAKRDFKAGEGAYDYSRCIAEAYTGYKHSQDKKPTHETGRVVLLDEISQLNLEKAMAPIKDVRLARQGKPLSDYIPQAVLPGAFLAATSNVPIADERLGREFGRIPVDYFVMTAKNPELYEFMLAKLLRDGGNMPTVSESALKPAFEKIVVPEDKRTKLQDGSTVVAEDKLAEDPTNKKHGFLYRLAFAIRTLQDAYIHGSKFNEKHLANTALYADFDNGKVIINGYIPDLKSDSVASPGGEMLKLTEGSSTLTAEIIAKWIEGYSEKGGDFIKWMQKMLLNHIHQTSPDDAEKIKAIFDYFGLLETNQGAKGSIEPLTPKEIGYLSPRVPRPLYVERPIKVVLTPVEAQAGEKKNLEAREKRAKELVLEDGSTVKVKENEFNMEVGGESMALTIDRKFRVKAIDYSFVGVVEDTASEHHGKLVGELVNAKDLHGVFTGEQVDRGVFVYEADTLLEDINGNIKKLMKVRWETTCVNNKENNPDNIPAPNF